jgi:hypothetical protein
MDQGENEELYPIAVLIDELKVGGGLDTILLQDADTVDL